MTLEDFEHTIQNNPDRIEFNDVIALIEDHYEYVPTTFTNGLDADKTKNEAGTNEGSCKIFAFAKILGLGQQQTLYCFGHYYRDDVLQNPDGCDHMNIRNFIKHGWEGIHFEGPALTEKL